MFEALGPGVSLGWDYLWQSTLFLGLGLAASCAFAGRPARRIGSCCLRCSPRSSRL